MITIVVGTSRVDAVSSQIGQYLYNSFANKSVPVSLESTTDHVTVSKTTPPWGEGGADTVPTKWKEIVSKTQTFIFILPEYNHGYPGEWKILMDSLYKEYAGKKAYVVGVGGGVFAGARVMEHVMPILVNFQFVIANERLHVPSAGSLFNEAGQIANDDLVIRFEKFVDSVIANN